MNNNDLSKKLSIVIPAFNEENGIGEVLKGLLSILPEAEIIVVDDGSSDDTARVVRKFDVNLIQNGFNLGYGASLKTGTKKTTRPYIAWFDADNEHQPASLKAMLQQLDESNSAAVIANRTHRSASMLRSFGKSIIKLTARILGVKLGDDINCGLRVFRRDAIVPYLEILPDKFSASVTSIMILVGRQFPFEFHPVQLNPRIGESKVKIMDGFDAIVLVLRMITLFAPLKIFFRSGLLLTSVGIMYSLFLAIKHGMGLPLAGVLLVTSGILFCLLGLIADQVSQLRLNRIANKN